MLLYLTFKNFIRVLTDESLFPLFFGFFGLRPYSLSLLVQSYLFGAALGRARLIPGHSNVSRSIPFGLYYTTIA